MNSELVTAATLSTLVGISMFASANPFCFPYQESECPSFVDATKNILCYSRSDEGDAETVEEEDWEADKTLMDVAIGLFGPMVYTDAQTAEMVNSSLMAGSKPIKLVSR